jgi:cation diffusion facilitator CzcD-associated flavoprotein CzcO
MFPSRDAVVDYLGGYARHKRLNVRLGIRVDRIERDDRRWALETSAGRWTAPQVIVATGGVRIADLFRRQPPCEARARFPGKRSPGSLSRLVPGGF